MAATTYPRLPNEEEKKEIADLVFGKPASEVDFEGVWLLAPVYNDLTFNCFGWSLLVSDTITIPKNIQDFNYLAGHATEAPQAPYNYTPTDRGAANAVVRAWGKGSDLHAARLGTKDLLKHHASDFQLKLNFKAPAAKGFPDEFWSSKFGDRMAFITHPRDWFQGSMWEDILQDFAREN